MIVGAHSILYSKEPEADRAFLRDVLGLSEGSLLRADAGPGLGAPHRGEAPGRRQARRLPGPARAPRGRAGAQASGASIETTGLARQGARNVSTAFPNASGSS